MTRTTAREIAVHLVYQLDFAPGARELLDRTLTREYFDALGEEEPLYAQLPDPVQEDYIRTLVTGVEERREELDGYISRYAVGWKLSRIPRVAVAVLRIAMFEVLYMPDVPDASAMDAAVEIAKRYEPAEVVSFLNGILGTFSRARQGDSTGESALELPDPAPESGRP